MLKASCPSCGSAVVFANKAFLATVCEFCHTVVAREGIDFTAHGKVGEIREDASPLMVGTEGMAAGKRFTLVGRIQLQYLDGTWNEWNMAFEDGTFAWLAEAMGQYSVQRPVMRPPPPQPFAAYKIGQHIELSGRAYIVRNAGRAQCIGGEGTLPFPVGGGYDLPFVDLVSHDDAVGTLDFSDVEPKLFLGQVMAFEDFRFTNLREELPPDHPMSRAGQAAVEAIRCLNCGAGLERKTGLQAKSIHCQYCGAGIDLTQHPYTLFTQQVLGGTPDCPIQIGDKGTFEGAEFEVIAMMVREAVQWGVTWFELLLWNVKKGYRWLVLANGHFTWVTPMHEWPADGPGTSLKARGQTLVYRETNQVAVRRVTGELYWRVKAGDRVQATDYSRAPYMLSAEKTDEEVTWSFGEYRPAKEILEAFGKQGRMHQSGLPWHQPAPMDRYLKPMALRWAIASVVLLVLAMVLGVMAENKVLAQASEAVEVPDDARLRGRVANGSKGTDVDRVLDKNTRWIGPLEVPEGPTNLKIAVETQLSNAWMWFHFALYNADKGTAIDFGEELSRYADEGSNSTYVIVPSVPKGTYHLRVEPIPGDFKTGGSVPWKVTVTRGVAMYRWIFVAWGLITLPLVITLIRKSMFEARRKRENS